MTWNGIEPPIGTDLLEIARRTLLDEIVPTLDGDARFKALMAANAMAIVARAMQPDASELPGIMQEFTELAGGDLRALCAEIRAGRHDPGSETHETVGRLLTAFARARCRISAPKALGE